MLNIPIELYTPLKIEDIENNINNKEEDENLIENKTTPFDDESINNIINNDKDINSERILNKFDFEIINMEDFYKILMDEKENKLIK